jgi:hypothetical protein
MSEANQAPSWPTGGPPGSGSNGAGWPRSPSPQSPWSRPEGDLPAASTKGRARTGPDPVGVAGGLFLISVGVHVAAMFPAYPGNPPAPIVSIPYLTAVYIILELGWALAAVLVLTRASVRGGLAFAAGLGTVELGFVISDLASTGQVPARNAPGIWLAIAALGVGYAGVLVGVSTVPMGRPELSLTDASTRARALATVVVALVVVAAFLPSWDRYHLVTSTGRTATITLGDAFSQPGGVMAGELIAAVAIGAIAIVGAFWVPAVVGAWLTAGAVCALTSQLVSAVVQVHQSIPAPVPGEHASLSLTGYWTLDVAATLALAGLALWAALDGRRAERDAGSSPSPNGGWAPQEHRPSEN